MNSPTEMLIAMAEGRKLKIRGDNSRHRLWWRDNGTTAELVGCSDDGDAVFSMGYKFFEDFARYEIAPDPYEWDAPIKYAPEWARWITFDDEGERLASACEAYIERVDPDYCGDMPAWFEKRAKEGGA